MNFDQRQQLSHQIETTSVLLLRLSNQRFGIGLVIII